MIKVKHLSFKRGENLIIDGLTFKLKKGEVLSIVGPSGSGKSTLLALLSGFLDPYKGFIWFGKEEVLGPSRKLIPGHSDIQLVNQEFSLSLYHTVRENITLHALHLSKEAREEMTDELLSLFSLSHLEMHSAISLSGGEKQRLALARALSKEPDVLLLDEPFAHLDAHLKRRVIRYLMALKKVRKTTFVLVSHEGRDVLSLSDRVAFFDEGKITRLDLPANFYNLPSSYYEGLFFGEMNRVILKGKEVFFRPSSYSLILSDSTLHLTVVFFKSIVLGPVIESHFLVDKVQSIILFSVLPIDYVKKIAII